mgnify:CR=1 FL=1
MTSESSFIIRNYFDNDSGVDYILKNSNLSKEILSEIKQFLSRSLSPHLVGFSKLSMLAGITKDSENVTLIPTNDMSKLVIDATKSVISAVSYALRRYKKDFETNGSIRISIGDADHHPNKNIVLTIIGQAGSWVYRPRSISTDIFLSNLICEFNLQDAFFVPEAGPKRRDYYWQKFVTENTDNETIDWVARGKFLCLAQACGITDLHSSNIILEKNKIAFFDTETLFQEFPTFREVTVEIEGKTIDSSCTPLFTGLLPLSRHSKNGSFFDSAYFGKSTPRKNNFCSTRRNVDVEKIVEGLVFGYEKQASYSNLEDKLGNLVNSSFPLKVRNVLRATETYGNIIEHASTQSIGKNDGFFRIKTKEILSSNPHIYEKTLRSEVSAITHGCIPFFNKEILSESAKQIIQKNISHICDYKAENLKIIARIVETSFLGDESLKPLEHNTQTLRL